MFAPTMPAVGVVALLVATSTIASADDRGALDACKAVIERAARAEKEKWAVASEKEDAEVARCRIVIREWTLRDSRMLVDEQGRPQR